MSLLFCCLSFTLAFHFFSFSFSLPKSAGKTRYIHIIVYTPPFNNSILCGFNIIYMDTLVMFIYTSPVVSLDTLLLLGLYHTLHLSLWVLLASNLPVNISSLHNYHFGKQKLERIRKITMGNIVKQFHGNIS